MKKFYEEHTDKLFSMSHQAKTRVRVQILLLIFQILKNEVHSKQMDRLMRVIYETLLDPGCLHSSITELYLELVYNVFKTDHSLPRVKAGIKRLLQNAIHAESNVAVAVLIFVNKLANSVTGLNQLLKNNFAVDDFEDKEEVDGEKANKEQDEAYPKDNGGYDFLKRDPLYAQAENSLLWELGFFTEHYHPTVRKFALEMRQNLGSRNVSYDSNPLLDFSMASFLSRFSMKKPKAAKTTGLQKLREGNKLSRSRVEEPFSLTAVMADNDASTAVRDEEAFMATYFKKKVETMDYLKKLEKRKAGRIKAPVDEDDEDRFADELFENELRKAEGKGEAAFDEFEDEEDEEGDEEDFNVDDFDGEIGDEGDEFVNMEDDGITLKKRAPKAKGGKKHKKANKKVIKKK